MGAIEKTQRGLREGADMLPLLRRAEERAFHHTFGTLRVGAGALLPRLCRLSTCRNRSMT